MTLIQRTRLSLTLFSIALIVFACVPAEAPSLQEIRTSIVPSPTEEPSITETPGKTGQAVFTNTEFFSFMPFNMKFFVDDWELTEDLETLESLVVDDCLLRPLLGRGSLPTEGPLDITLGDVAYTYFIERHEASTVLDQEIVTYFIYHAKTEDDLANMENVWAFELVTSVQSEKSCFEASKPVLSTLETWKLNPLNHITWDQTKTQAHCVEAAGGRLIGFTVSDGIVYLNTTEDLGQVYQFTFDNPELVPVVTTGYPDGAILSPFFLDGGYLVYQDTDHLMNPMDSKIISHNLETGENVNLFEWSYDPGVRYPVLHFTVENGKVYITSNEYGPLNDDYNAAITAVNLDGTSSEILYMQNEDKVGLGRLGVSEHRMLVEQVRIHSKNPSGPLDFVLFDISDGLVNIVESFNQAGTYPLISQNQAVWVNQAENVKPETYSIYDFSENALQEGGRIFGEFAEAFDFTGNYYSWAAAAAEPDFGKRLVYLVDLRQGITLNLAADLPTVGLIEPQVVEDSLWFAMVTNFFSADSISSICSVPLSSLFSLSEGE